MSAFIEKNFYNSGSDLLYRHVGQDVYVGRFQSGRSPVGKPQAIRLLVANYDVDAFVLRTKRAKIFDVLKQDGHI